MIQLNGMKVMFWQYTDPFFVWFNALPKGYKIITWISAGIIGSYLIYKVAMKVKSMLPKKAFKKLPEQNIETQKNMERESQIECSNNENSKIINNVYNM